jgi:hypothetical protein
MHTKMQMTFLLWNGTACEHATQTVPSGEVRECYELMKRTFSFLGKETDGECNDTKLLTNNFVSSYLCIIYFNSIVDYF